MSRLVHMARCGRQYEHQPHGGPTATRDASCDGVLRLVEWDEDDQ